MRKKIKESGDLFFIVSDKKKIFSTHPITDDPIYTKFIGSNSYLELRCFTGTQFGISDFKTRGYKQVENVYNQVSGEKNE